LVDVHEKTTDTTPTPATHQRGSEKIDFILTSPRVANTITAASILALQDGYFSDHRSLLVDFDALALFGSATSTVAIPTTRRLTSTDPQAVNRYIQHMKKHISVHRIVEKVAELKTKSNNGEWDAECIVEYETMDALLQEGRAAAETKCRSREKRNYPWSPELEKAGSAALYWKLRVWELSSHQTNEETIQRLAGVAGISEEDKEWLTSQEVRKKRRQARRTF
jgi:hypothetical protein